MKEQFNIYHGTGCIQLGYGTIPRRINFYLKLRSIIKDKNNDLATILIGSAVVAFYLDIAHCFELEQKIPILMSNGVLVVVYE